MILFYFENCYESRKVEIVGPAFEVTHKFSLGQGQIEGNFGEISYPADKVLICQPHILLRMVEARLINVNKHIHTHD